MANTQQDNIRVPFGYAVNYHMIRTDDMLNGDGLRVVLFLSGCEHQCNGCHNPETWDVRSGKPLTISVLKKIYQELDKDYISGITLVYLYIINKCFFSSKLTKISKNVTKRYKVSGKILT